MGDTATPNPNLFLVDINDGRRVSTAGGVLAVGVATGSGGEVEAGSTVGGLGSVVCASVVVMSSAAGSVSSVVGSRVGARVGINRSRGVGGTVGESCGGARIAGLSLDPRYRNPAMSESAKRMSPPISRRRFLVVLATQMAISAMPTSSPAVNRSSDSALPSPDEGVAWGGGDGLVVAAGAGAVAV